MSASDAAAELKRRLADLPEAARAEVSAALGEVAAETIEVARGSLARISPSAPGEPPADAGGRLADLLSWSVDTTNTQVTVRASDPAAMFLEYGTRRMAARPFLRPAAVAITESARTRLRDALARAATRVFGGRS